MKVITPPLNLSHLSSLTSFVESRHQAVSLKPIKARISKAHIYLSIISMGKMDLDVSEQILEENFQYILTPNVDQILLITSLM